MSGLEFTDAAAKRLEKIYLTRDVIAQRSEILEQLALIKGERVLDIGSGPGFLCESIAALVGSEGAVVGIDISADLVGMCERRNPPKCLSFAVGDATRIDRPDASFDAVVCAQVAEYVPDVGRVISEAYRLLKPGGRTIFVATDWDAVVWNSQVPDRMARIMKSWRAHCAHANLPRSLAHRLESVGFRLDGASVFPILNLSWDDDAYSKGLAELIRNFVATRGDVPAEEPGKWLDEFPELHQGGQYFFSSNRYIFHASKAA
jgi:ubiquinone/menaquinone biosynthesis C-methylase UbiE